MGDGKVDESRALLLEPFLELLARRVRVLRRAHGMTLAELEAKSGVNISSIWLIERAQVNVTVWTCLKIAKGLEVEVIELFREREEESW